MNGQATLLTTEQAAKRFGLSARTLERFRASGEGPEFVKMGRAVRYTVAKLNEWLEARSRRSTSDDGSRQRCMRIDCPR